MDAIPLKSTAIVNMCALMALLTIGSNLQAHI